MITYRKADVHDVESIADLHAESWQLNYRGMLDDHFLDAEVFANRLQVWSGRMCSIDANMTIVLAEEGNTLVGFGCLFLNHDSEFGALLDNLHVAKSYGGMGIGTTIIKTFVSEILNAGGRKDMYLWVLEENFGAIRLYDKLQGQRKETGMETELGPRPVPKYRYYWPNVGMLLKEL